ncbi:MAG: DUF485 domain-containing protein [Gammaproteobacteria bacterium]
MMQELYERIAADPEFRALERRRSRFGWALALIMLAAFYGFVLVIAFYPGLFATPLGPGTVVTWGIPVAVGVILLGFALTGLYVWRANGEFDRGFEAIVRRLQAGD